jgi:5-methyltetrahydrofolate--homocysteine methyltransferase
MSTLDSIKTAVIDGSTTSIKGLTEKALAEGVDPMEIFQEALVPAMDIVGQGMRAGELYLPEVILAAKAMKISAELLKPLIARTGDHAPRGRVVIGTVTGDMHDIGKNVVIMLLEGAGFEVIDLGTDASEARFTDAIRREQPDIVAMSALLTATMVNMRRIVAGITGEGLREQVKVMVGGAPLSQRFADEIGADGFARDAAGAVELAKNWTAPAAQT